MGDLVRLNRRYLYKDEGHLKLALLQVVEIDSEDFVQITFICGVNEKEINAVCLLPNLWTVKERLTKVKGKYWKLF